MDEMLPGGTKKASGFKFTQQQMGEYLTRSSSNLTMI